MLAYIAAAYFSTISILLILLIVTLKQYLNKKNEFAIKSSKADKK